MHFLYIQFLIFYFYVILISYIIISVILQVYIYYAIFFFLGCPACRIVVPQFLGCWQWKDRVPTIGHNVIIWDNPHIMCLRGCMLGHFTCVQLFVTLWTIVHQAPLSMGFSRQEYGSGLACPPSGDLPDPGIKSESPALQADSLPTESSGKPHIMH